jgi:hypothetical protein
MIHRFTKQRPVLLEQLDRRNSTFSILPGYLGKLTLRLYVFAFFRSLPLFLDALYSSLQAPSLLASNRARCRLSSMTAVASLEATALSRQWYIPALWLSPVVRATVQALPTVEMTACGTLRRYIQPFFGRLWIYPP